MEAVKVRQLRQYLGPSLMDIWAIYRISGLFTMMGSTWLPCSFDADWCVRSDVMTDSCPQALELVRKPMGAFNWALFKPDPADFKLYDAGSLGVRQTRPLDTVLTPF